MKKQLKKVTDLTINDLLNNDVIMPSIYFEKFNKNARTFELNVEDSSFEKELNKILVEDFNLIEQYMHTIENNASIIKDAVKDTKKALVDKDVETLTDIYSQMLKLEKEVKSLNKKLFVDDLTSSNNRKWIYNKFLNKEAKFKTNGTCVLIDITNYTYVQDKYGELIANNLIIFINNFIIRKIKDENINFKIARFFDSQFFIFIENENEKEISNLIFNMQQLIKDTTLTSKTGLVINADYNYVISKYQIDQESKDIFETLFLELKENIK